MPRACISAATFYKWKAKFGGMNVGEAQRLRQLEDENAKLKRLPEITFDFWFSTTNVNSKLSQSERHRMLRTSRP
jgi:predicted NUDIX family NTP pyrophosphohydrolase